MPNPPTESAPRSTKDRLHDLVEISTDVSVLLRELCIVALFVMLFFAPNTFKSLLTGLGISNISTPLGQISVAEASGTVADLNRGLTDSVALLQQIQSASTDPQAQSDVAKVTQSLQGLQQEAQTADDTLKTTLVNQQAAAEKASPAAAKLSGWIFMGNVDKDQEHWTGDTSRNIVPSSIPPKLTVNQTFSVANPAYLRDSPSKGKVIGVVKAGGAVQVQAAPVCSAAISGGYFCSVKVQPL
jgi:hypothetical protein